MPFLTIGCIAFSSCNNKQISPNIKPMFNEEDTTIVLEMTESWLKLIQNKDYDTAMSFLYNLESGALEKISQERANELKNQFILFPILSYSLQSMEWRNVYDVTLTYSFDFMDSEEDNIPHKMAVTFAPQKRNNIWYLAIARKD